MISARLHRLGYELQIDRISIPIISRNEVLVNVRACGICHSDINYSSGIAPVGRLPITLGHEISGTIARTGQNVRGIHEGDSVLVHYIISCGFCEYCRTGHENYCARYKMIGKDVDGGFAEYVKVPARSIVKLPYKLPFEQAAIMGCAVPTAYHALKRGRVRPGDTVVVFGIGGLGIHAVQMARRVFKAGLVVAVDVLDWKLKLAQQLGAKATVNASAHDVPEEISEITDGNFCDVAIDFVGRKGSVEQAIASVGKGGRVVLVGISKDTVQISPYKTVIGREMEIIGVDDHLKSELVELLQFVRLRKIDLARSVTHRVALESINQGFRILESDRENAVRIVVTNKPSTSLQLN